MEMKHYIYNDCTIDENSTKNISLVDNYINETDSGRVFHGNYSWAGLFQKLSMLGFTCRYNKDMRIQIQQLFCPVQSFESLNSLIINME